MALDHVLLALLEQSPAHGYRLCRRLEDVLGELRSVQASHVYAALAALERRAMVIARSERTPRGVERRVYAPTAAGRAHLRAWLAAPDPNRALLRRPLLMKVAVLAALGERMPARLLRAERIVRERLLRGPRPPSCSPAAELLRERAVRHLEVELWLLDRLADDPDGRS